MNASSGFPVIFSAFVFSLWVHFVVVIFVKFCVSLCQSPQVVVEPLKVFCLELLLFKEVIEQTANFLPSSTGYFYYIRVSF